MRTFETLLLFSLEFSSEDRESLLSTLTSTIKNVDGSATLDHWGMRELAYHVQKQTRGYYVRLEYTAPGSIVEELERIIRINSGVLKFITVKLKNPIKEVA